jgi:hypothetical protein
MEHDHSFTVRMKTIEMERLRDLANQTGRSRGAVMRRLLSLAETPEGRRVLGEPPKHKQEVLA